MSLKFNPKLYHIILIAYCAGIFVLSSIPGDNFPKVEFELSDKFVHAIIYGILFILFFYSLKYQTKNVNLQKYSMEYSLLFTSVYGLSDEIHQYFVVNRSCEFGDWVADVIGALIVYLVIKIHYYKNKKYILAVLLFTFYSCSSADTDNKNNNAEIALTESDAWLNLMPVIDERKNNFGFLISLNLENSTSEGNYTIRDFTIFLNNDTLRNKKYQADIFEPVKGTLKINLSQLNEESYLDKNKSQPVEARFRFSIYNGQKKITTYNTPKLQILKVY